MNVYIRQRLPKICFNLPLEPMIKNVPKMRCFGKRSDWNSLYPAELLSVIFIVCFYIYIQIYKVCLCASLVLFISFFISKPYQTIITPFVFMLPLQKQNRSETLVTMAQMKTFQSNIFIFGARQIAKYGSKIRTGETLEYKAVQRAHSKRSKQRVI